MTCSGYPEDGAVGLDHFRHQLLEAGAMAPAELGERLGRVAQPQVDLGRPAIGGIARHQDLAAALADAVLVEAVALPLEAAVDLAEGELDEFAHRVGLTGGEHVIVGLLLLQDAPHALDVVTRMAPGALGVEVAEEQRVLEAALDRGHRAADLAGHAALAV